MGTAVVSLTTTDKQDTACQTTTPCKSNHCSTTALLEQDICKNFIGCFFKVLSAKTQGTLFLILIISRILQAAQHETEIFMVVHYFVLHFFKFHILSSLYSSFRTHFCSPIPYFLLPLLFPTPILSTSPSAEIYPYSTPSLNSKACRYLSMPLAPWAGHFHFSGSFLQPVWFFSPSHDIFRLHSPCHSAAVGQLPLLTEAKTADPAAEATTHIIHTVDILADKEALFPFSCFFHLQEH